MATSMWKTALRAVRDALRPSTRPSRSSSRPSPGSPARAHAYAGDAPDVPELRYAPFDDDRPDPGEIVWAWVPFEEDPTQGKDRPVLLIGRDGRWLVGLQLTSKDHDRDEQQERRAGREWVDIGTGAWDRQHRPSEVRVDRVLQLDPTAVRRQGAALDRRRFDLVAAAVRSHHPAR